MGEKFDKISKIEDFKSKRARDIAKHFELRVDEIPKLAGNLEYEIDNATPGSKRVTNSLAASSVINYELGRRVAFEIEEPDGDVTLIPRMYGPKKHQAYARNLERGMNYAKKKQY